MELQWICGALGAFLLSFLLGSLSCLEEQRWSNCIRSSNFVGHHLKSTGKDQNCHMTPFSNLNILTSDVLLRLSRTSHHQLCPFWKSFWQQNLMSVEPLLLPFKVSSSKQNHCLVIH